MVRVRSLSFSRKRHLGATADDKRHECFAEVEGFHVVHRVATREHPRALPDVGTIPLEVFGTPLKIGDCLGRYTKRAFRLECEA